MRGCSSLLMFLCLALLKFHVHGAVPMLGKGPTHGFTSLPLNSSNFEIQRPYDLEASERYSFINGIHKLWVLSTDKPHSLTSNTSARTEIRIRVGVSSILSICIYFNGSKMNINMIANIASDLQSSSFKLLEFPFFKKLVQFSVEFHQCQYLFTCLVWNLIF